MTVGASGNRSREIRLGVVMYGGVSLAVYENGVAQELFRAVKGEGVYALLKELTGSDIVVDIVSGTSAGGINGILLSYALANDRDFLHSAQLWREHGDILRLLRSPREENPRSLLNSEGYYQPRLEAAFREMPDYDGTRQVPGYDSKVPELDLFVTGTDVDGHVYTEVDDQGHAIDVKDHRGLFVLSYREGRKNEFGPVAKTPRAQAEALDTEIARAAALAKLARITSCFPVAFSPVLVKNPGENPKEADGLLQIWGKLGREACFLDGGVLDNKPFSYTTEAIFARTCERSVERLLLYVEPDPERFAQNGSASVPNVLEAAIGALVTIPGYESISSDLKEIARRNDTLQCYRDITAHVENEGLKSGGSVDEVMGSALARLEEAQPITSRMYRSARLTQLRDRAVRGILKKDGQLKSLGPGGKKAATALVKSFQKWRGDEIDTLENFDVYFRQRRLTQVVYKIHALLDGETQPPEEHQSAYKEALWSVNRQIQLLEIVRFYLESLIDRSAILWISAVDQAEYANKTWTTLRNGLCHLLSTEGIEVPAPDSDPRHFADALKERVAGLAPRIETLQACSDRLLLSETDRMERQIFTRLEEKIPENIATRVYAVFTFIDAHLFPIELASGLHARDILRIVRISPFDAQRAFSARKLNEKLCGDELGHFSGFLKRSWRSNDILWGRIDTVCQLIECLLTKRLLGKTARGPLPAQVSIDRLFPTSDPAARKKLDLAIGQIHSLSSEAFNDFKTELIEAAQREILQTEVKGVVEDAIAQDIEWNQFRVPAADREQPTNENVRYDVERMVWRSGEVATEPLLTDLVKERLVQEPARGWAKYFQDSKVGEERFSRHIPPLVLLEILTTAALVLRNCLLNALPQNGMLERVRSSPLYRFTLGMGLPLIYNFVRFERRAPDASRIATSLVYGIVIALLAKSLMDKIGGREIGNPAIFVFAPLAIFTALSIWFARDHLPKPGRAMNWRGVAIIAGLAAGLFGVLYCAYLWGDSKNHAWAAAVAACAALFLLLAGRRRRAKITKKLVRQALLDYMPSAELRVLAVRFGVPGFDTFPPAPVQRARLVDALIARVPLADLVAAIRETRPGVLPW